MSEALEKQLAEALRSIYRGLDLAHDELLQLSPKELAFLLFLDDAGESRVKEMAEQVKLPLSTASWTVDKMVNKGFLQRKTDPTDRRAIILSLAEQGEKALRKHREIFDTIARVVVLNFSREEAESAVLLIEKVTAFFRRH